jgi:protein phosphatase
VQVRHDGLPYWLVLNVGDSRVYRVAGARFERMTIDHSYMQEQLDAGLLSLEEAETFEHKNVITRAVGAPDSPADYWVHPVEAGERLLICSDGLHGELSEAELFDVLARESDPGDAVGRLVQLALDHGGHDNITAIVVEVADAPAPPAEEESPLAEEQAEGPRLEAPQVDSAEPPSQADSAEPLPRVDSAQPLPQVDSAQPNGDHEAAEDV